MNIRPACPADIPGLIRLLYQVGQVHHLLRPDIFRPGTLKYDAPALEALLEDGDKPIFVAAEGDAVLGYCFCVIRRYQGGTAMVDRTELYIDDLCVEESCRGSGVAESLYRHVTAFARDLGCAFITLNLWCGNGRAQGFYEKMGLTPRSVTMEMPLEERSC